jgi:hypothetical protein
LTEESTTDKKLSRRQFVGTAAAGAAVLGASALIMPKLSAGVPGALPAASKNATSGAEAQPVEGVPTNWDYTADVVIVGYGLGGAVAAITASDLGADVLVLEKAPFQGGGSFRMSGGGCTWPMDVTNGAAYAYACSFGATPYDVCEAWAIEGVNNKAWYDSMGIKYSQSISPEYPNLPGASACGMLSLTGNGAAGWVTLNNQVLSRPIKILFNTPGTHLIQNPQTNEIVGVQAVSYPIPTANLLTLTAPLPIPTTGGTTINVKAKRAVILATGGIMYNEVHKQNFLRIYPFTAYSWKYCTGDGLRMAQEVGADLWHTSFVYGRASPWYVELQEAGYIAGEIGGTPSKNNYIQVDKYGHRFWNEKSAGASHGAIDVLTDFNPAVPEYTRIPSYIIMDQTAISAGPLVSATMGSCRIPTALGGYPAWSSDNSAEIAKGWIQQGPDIPTLVANLNKGSRTYTYLGQLSGLVNGYVPSLDPNIVAAEVKNYNSYCASGVDLEFGRPASGMAPIQTPPYYGIALWPGCSDAGGGPRHNALCQVVDTSGNAIPRLYEAGAVGCWLGQMYTSTSGGLITNGVTFGRIAAKNAAQETPWTR